MNLTVQSSYMYTVQYKVFRKWSHGAIRPITAAEKSAAQIGHAVWIADNRVVSPDGVDCGNCARHCPTGAIHGA